MEIRKPDYTQLNLLIEEFNEEWKDVSFCDIAMFTDFLLNYGCLYNYIVRMMSGSFLKSAVKTVN